MQIVYEEPDIYEMTKNKLFYYNPSNHSIIGVGESTRNINTIKMSSTAPAVNIYKNV